LERLTETNAEQLGFSSLPFVRVSEPQQRENTYEASLASLEQARFGVAGPLTPLARELWASAHELLGTVWLRRGRVALAVSEFSRALALTPLRAAARSNLGVALERAGDLGGALNETAHALELDPLRATPWVNLTRLLLRVQGPAAAREALVNASRHDVHDPRLDALAQALQAAPAAQGTTRK
jgi:Flp pilus assembly protein TadD